MIEGVRRTGGGGGGCEPRRKLDLAGSVEDLDSPSYRIEALLGEYVL